MYDSRQPVTLRESLCACASDSPGRLFLRVVHGADDVVELSHAEFLARVEAAARGLARLHTDDAPIILAVPTSADLLAVYLAASTWAGVPPMFVPAAEQKADRADAEHELARLVSLADSVGASAVVVADAFAQSQAQSQARTAATRLLAIGDIMRSGSEAEASIPPRPRSIAHLQRTSGTTGTPRVLAVTHENILANVDAMGSQIDLVPNDHLLIWLPLFHDMGLIAFCCALRWNKPVTIVETRCFARNPVRYWLGQIGRFGATITAAPNSAYHLCARLGRRHRVDVDLSTLRLGFWGAEMIYPETVELFTEIFAPHGYRPEATFPVYGLAEATLGATLPPIRAPHVEDAFTPEGRDAPVRVCAVGRALPGHELRIVGPDGQPCPEGRVGEIELSGPSVVEDTWTPARERRPQSATRWLQTGDLGYVRNGELHVVGRKKELIIVNGRNVLPIEIEEQVRLALQPNAELSERVRSVLALGFVNPKLKTESVGVVVESRPLEPEVRAKIEVAIVEGLSRSLDLHGVHVRWVRSGALPRTTSGKPIRNRCVSMFGGPS